MLALTKAMKFVLAKCQQAVKPRPFAIVKKTKKNNQYEKME